MSTPTSISPLRNLVNILSDAITKVDQKYASANLEFPALDRPFRKEDPAWSLLSSPDVIPLTSVIVAVADQLIASARPPAQTILDMSHTVRVIVGTLPPTEVAINEFDFDFVAFHSCVLEIGLRNQRCRDLARGRAAGWSSLLPRP